MTTQPDLIPTEPSETPALVNARRDVARALDDFQETGGDEVSSLWLREARERLAALEAAEIARRKKA